MADILKIIETLSEEEAAKVKAFFTKTETQSTSEKAKNYGEDDKGQIKDNSDFSDNKGQESQNQVEENNIEILAMIKAIEEKVNINSDGIKAFKTKMEVPILKKDESETNNNESNNGNVNFGY